MTDHLLARYSLFDNFPFALSACSGANFVTFQLMVDYLMELNTHGHAVLRKCESWIGFSTLRRVIEKYPTIEIYAAGGIVRDILSGSGNPPKDFDFFIQGDEAGYAIADLATLGELTSGPFGSPRWTPLNSDEQYADLIPIKVFRNGLWQCDDIVDVLNQFDFTANAVAVDLRRLSVYDPQNGVRDARNKVLRAVRFDYPDEVIAPGSSMTRPFVLWCRLLHYAAMLNFHIEPVTLAWLRSQIRYVTKIAEFEAAFFPMHPNALSCLDGAAI